MDQHYENQQLTQPILVSGLLTGQLVTLQPPFLLSEADFLRLKGGPPVTVALATIVFSGVVGYAFSLGPKISPLFGGGKLQLEAGEIGTIVAVMVLSVVLYAIGYWWSNDKKELMKKISQHFESRPPSSGIVGDKK
jgi:hypothetical protein